MARLGLVGGCFLADNLSVHCRHMCMMWRLKGRQWQGLSCRAGP